MARCNNCAKMVSYNTEEDPEANQEPEVHENKVTAEYRRVLTCADCSTELKEALLEFEMDIVNEDGSDVANDCPGEGADLDVAGDEPHDWVINGEPTIGPTHESGSRYAKSY